MPILLAGTARAYSRPAISQLRKTTNAKGAWRNFKWPYQAVVMNRFDAKSISHGAIAGQDRDGMAEDSLA
jgi:hypothetical protein